MKEIIVLLTIFVMLSANSIALSQYDTPTDNSQMLGSGNDGTTGSGSNASGSSGNQSGAGSGSDSPDSGSQAGTLTQDQIQQQFQKQTSEMTQIRTQAQERKQVMQQQLEQQMQGESEKVQEMLKNQNEVRLAVHALLDIENLTGGIGKNVSAIARGFNNSVQSTYRAEEKIQTRSGFSRFFSGGDKKAAEEIEQKMNQSQEKIMQLNQIREQCSSECSEEVKSMIQEQTQTLQHEQTRLQQLAQNEKKSKGLLGWIWK